MDGVNCIARQKVTSGRSQLTVLTQASKVEYNGTLGKSKVCHYMRYAILSKKKVCSINLNWQFDFFHQIGQEVFAATGIKQSTMNGSVLPRMSK